MAQRRVVRIIKIELALGLVLLGLWGWVALPPSAVGQIVDAVRNVVGPEPIAFAEDVFYSAMDSVQQVLASHNLLGSASPAAAVVIPSSNRGNAPVPIQPNFALRPEESAPRQGTSPAPNEATAGDGIWTPIPNSFDPGAAPLMYKTLLHPDRARAYAQVAVVAMDATRLRLHVVAGTSEPESPVRVSRPGLIPTSDRSGLVATFNGGFKAIHGNHGMMVNGQMILAPKRDSDTIALYRDGTVRIAPWSIISNTLPLMQSFRQTPPYLVMKGQANPDLQKEQIFSWGKSISGKVAIWRSALGISADGRTLYYAAGEALTAQTLAQSLVAAGASDVAELDVNWSFERFLIYAPLAGKWTERVLLDAMVYQPGIYVSRPSAKDFFYVTLVK